MPNKLGNSAAEQKLLRAVALWAVNCAEQALPVFESRHPDDTRPRKAIAAGRAFAQGKRRSRDLRVLSMAAFKIIKELDEPSKHAAHAASLTAAVAYTHTDLQGGVQGSRQARHVLGPVVYSALALETAAGNDSNVGNNFIDRAIRDAPPEARRIVERMEPQPKKEGRRDELFSVLDAALRGEATRQ